MYIDIMKVYRSEIERYCLENGLSIDKVFSAPCAHNNEQAILHYLDPDYKSPIKGMLVIGGPPAPTTLSIYLQDDDTLRFEQTEITRKYLGSEVPVAEPAMV